MPVAGEVATGETFDGETEAAMFPGDLPADPNDLFRNDDNAFRGLLLGHPAYHELERQIGQCGTVGFAEASVAVPFVGAAAGAITVAQLIRLACLESTPLLLQMELGAPEMASFGGFAPAPDKNLGSFSMKL
jgi:hypothetical protein